MKIYTIKLYSPKRHFTMPYYFTSLKEAVLYGEYAFRNDYDMTYYEIRKCFKPSTFYKLK